MNIKNTIFKGTLAIITMAISISAKDFKGAELFTKDIYKYGKYEARMMMATGNGLVSSMFLYHNDSYMGGNEPWVEVDMEVLGKNPQEWQSNIITGKAEAKITSEAKHPISPAVNTSYHTYGFEWTPTYVAWTIDGNVIRKTEVGKNDPLNQVQALIKQQGLRFNLWSSNDEHWVGAWDPSILPVHQYINWVKVYSYNPGQGDNGTDFKLLWTDNFDNFDNNRWGAGDWTFDGNRVEMSPNNINVKDGTLILSITRAGQEGFNGNVPRDNEQIDNQNNGNDNQNNNNNQNNGNNNENNPNNGENGNNNQNNNDNQNNGNNNENNPNNGENRNNNQNNNDNQNNGNNNENPQGIILQKTQNFQNAPHGIVNAKGARVKSKNHSYRVNFKF